MENLTSEELIERANEFAVSVIDAVEKYSPEAAQLALEVGRIEAIQEVVLCVVLILGSTLAFFMSKGLMKIAVKKEAEREERSLASDAEIGATVGSIISGAISLILFVCFIFNLINVPAWVGMWHPEVYLAHRLVFGG